MRMDDDAAKSMAMFPLGGGQVTMIVNGHASPVDLLLYLLPTRGRRTECGHA
jgi:hypothetical protein